MEASAAAVSASHQGDRHHATPIRHVIVIVGENRTFDHLFATYKPHHGEYVDNLRSKGIVNADGTPGPNFARANQFAAQDIAPDPWEPSPGGKTLYETLPPPTVESYDAAPAFASVADAKAAENGLADAYYSMLTTGGSGLGSGGIDTRIAGYNHLRPGPFQLTGAHLTDDDYAGSPVHRFYQMWQQLDCDAAYATAANPSGCLSDLWPWVEQTIAAGSNGKPKPPTFDGEGSIAMGFYNMAQGDAAYTKQLADRYAMSDNFHQAVEGGTGANHVA
ncbi:MAG TPA: hypothetical protein VFQ65_06500, partial [Kofleriaceae bacterium]|nr:hypothetical protein [Kofleriaceae bacterium]